MRLIVALGAFILIAGYARWNSVILTPLWYFAISASSAAVMIGASVFLVRLRWATPLTVIGNHSFQIYLTHFLAVAGVRIVLIKLGITSPVIILLLAVPAAVAFALFLNAAASAGAGRFLFERPAAFKLSRPVSPPMQTPEH